MDKLKWLVKWSTYYYFGDAPVHASGITLDKDSISLTTAWQTEQLTATVAPENAVNKKVLWSSSDTSVATVSSTGLVTCITPGSCTITATCVDGGASATCSIKELGSWNLSDYTLTSSFDSYSSVVDWCWLVVSQDWNSLALVWSKMFAWWSSWYNAYIIKFWLTSPYDVSWMSQVLSWISRWQTYFSWWYMKPDWTKIYFLSSPNWWWIEEWDITWWDITTLSNYSSKTSLVDGNYLYDCYFSPDWTKLFISWHNKIYFYELSTPWDLSSLWIYTEYSANLNSWIYFYPNWTKLYLEDYINKKIKQYNLSTPWDLSSCDFSSPDYVLNTWTTYNSTWMTFSDDFKHLIISWINYSWYPEVKVFTYSPS